MRESSHGMKGTAIPNLQTSQLTTLHVRVSPNFEKAMVVLGETRCSLHSCSVETVCAGNSSSFVCGLYELTDSGAQQRSGRIALYSWSADNQLTLQTEVDTKGGVLDMKPCQNGEDCLIAATLSVGQLDIYTVNNDSLKLKASLADSDDDSLYLSTSWSSNSFSSQSRVAVSTQMSSVLVCQLAESGISVNRRLSNCHSRFGEYMPIWIVAFDPHSENNRLLSGGDDCAMRLWDFRQDCNQAITSNVKTHQSGVTSALWHPQDEHCFATGSYDEYLRLWDDRNLSRPTAEIHTGGGVWRIKWTERAPHHIITANMHGGCGVYELNADYTTVASSFTHTDIDRNENHLAYGIDVLDITDGSFTLSSCSFYDNLLQIWTAPRVDNI